MIYISTHSLREKADFHIFTFSPNKLISTHSLREKADLEVLLSYLHIQISTHSLREKADVEGTLRCIVDLNFNSQPPRKGWRFLHLPRRPLFSFQLTASAKRLTELAVQKFDQLAISTHSLREKADSIQARVQELEGHFNSQPPRKGWLPAGKKTETATFISTHSLREKADTKSLFGLQVLSYFNSQPPRKGWQAFRLPVQSPCSFQLTASAKRLTEKVRVDCLAVIFQLTASAKRLTAILA